MAQSLEDAAVFGYHPARDAHNLLGVAPKRWLDPAFCAVGKNAVGINWRRGRVVRNERDAESASASTEKRFERFGSGFESTFEGLPPAHSSAGGAVLACMTDESARAAGTRNSMAADTRFAAAVRPYATPLIGYGDWGVLVGMHRGAVFGNEGEKPTSDVLRITDIVADLARRREKRENPAEESSVAATNDDGGELEKNQKSLRESKRRRAKTPSDDPGRFAGGGAAGILARRRRDAGGCRLAQAASVGGGDDDKKVTLRTTRRCSNITRLNGDETRRPFH